MKKTLLITALMALIATPVFANCGDNCTQPVQPCDGPNCYGSAYFGEMVKIDMTGYSGAIGDDTAVYSSGIHDVNAKINNVDLEGTANLSGGFMASSAGPGMSEASGVAGSVLTFKKFTEWSLPTSW